MTIMGGAVTSTGLALTFLTLFAFVSEPLSARTQSGLDLPNGIRRAVSVLQQAERISDQLPCSSRTCTKFAGRQLRAEPGRI